MTFVGSHPGVPARAGGDPVGRAPTRRDKVEALGLLLGMLAMLLGATLWAGAIR